jgi:hypothetical protein
MRGRRRSSSSGVAVEAADLRLFKVVRLKKNDTDTFFRTSPTVHFYNSSLAEMPFVGKSMGVSFAPK